MTQDLHLFLFHQFQQTWKAIRSVTTQSMKDVFLTSTLNYYSTSIPQNISEFLLIKKVDKRVTQSVKPAFKRQHLVVKAPLNSAENIPRADMHIIRHTSQKLFSRVCIEG